MNSTVFSLIGIVALGLSACDDGANPDRLAGSESEVRGPQNAAGRDPTSFHHENDPAATGTEPAARATGSPEVTSRLHGCGKITVASLRNILVSRGLIGDGARPGGAPSGADLYLNAATPAALGGANYNSRTPEAPFASTSAMSKMFDIFTMASYDAVSPTWTAPACPDVKLLGGDGKFTKDGLSCLMGKPAREEHVAIANDAIVKNPADGAKLAIAALLAAAHTCQ